MLSSNAIANSPNSAQPSAIASATSKPRDSFAAMDTLKALSSPTSANQGHSFGSRPFPWSLSDSNSDAGDNDNNDDDDNNSDHVDGERYRQFRAPSPIALRTGPKSGMSRNFGFDDAPLPAATSKKTVPVSAAAARDARNLGYGVELGLEFPDIPRFGATSRPSRVDSAWTTASKMHLPQEQPLPTVVDDPLASFAIPILSTAATPKSAFAPSPSHPTTAALTSTYYRTSNNNNNNNNNNTDERLAQLRAAILDVSADQARDHLRSRQLFTQHRPHINSLVQRLFTVHETDPYFVVRSLALLAKFDSPYKRQRVLLTLDAMEHEMTKDEERELLGLDADADEDDRAREMDRVDVDQPAMVNENSYLHSLHAASSAVKDSLHMHQSPHPRAQVRPSPPPKVSSSSSVSDSGRHRGRRGRPSQIERVEPHRVRASVGSTIPLFPSSALASTTAHPRSTTSISPSSSSANARQSERAHIVRRGRGEDDDSTATCTTVSSSSRSASDQDQSDGEDNDQLLDLNALLLAATTADTTTGGATAMIRDQLTQERQRLLFEQEQLRLMLQELKMDVSVMERVASLQAQREADQIQLLGGEVQIEDDEAEELGEEGDADQDRASVGAGADSGAEAHVEEECLRQDAVVAGAQEKSE